MTIKAIAKALDYLHTEKRILHGDLKGANVLIVGDFDAIKLCDFGVTLPLDEKGVADFTRQYVGTQPWSAKEVIEEETITTKTDIYALGCVIFEMLSLDTPHAGTYLLTTAPVIYIDRFRLITIADVCPIFGQTTA